MCACLQSLQKKRNFWGREESVEIHSSLKVLDLNNAMKKREAEDKEKDIQPYLVSKECTHSTRREFE